MSAPPVLLVCRPRPAPDAPSFGVQALVRQRWETAWAAATADQRLTWLCGLRFADARLPVLQTLPWAELSSGVTSRIIDSNRLPPAPERPAIAKGKARRARG